MKQVRDSEDDHFLEEDACREVISKLQRLPNSLSSTAAENVLATIDEYDLLEQIGHGGMGDVFRARHRRLNRIVAIKLLKPELSDNRQATERFEREMKAVGSLDHPNIVRAIHAGEDDGTLFLAMEYVEGQSVSSLVNNGSCLSLGQACNIVAQAAAGLAHAHDHGLIHRDVKPSNMMINENGCVQILDLGLACFKERIADGRELTKDGQVMGTPDYMSPEQIRNSRDVDERTDVYSLGATFYKLLTGRAPFADDQHPTPESCILAIGSEEVLLIRKLRPEVPETLETLIHQMLAKSAEARQPDFATVIESLKPHLSQDVDPERAASKDRARAAGRFSAWKAWAFLAAAIFSAAAVFFYVSTNYGSIELASDDLHAEPRALGLTVSIENLATGEVSAITAETSQLALPVGRYTASVDSHARLQIKEANGRELTVTDFEISRGAQVMVRIDPPVGDFALEFDGNSYFEIPELEWQAGQEYTIEAWVMAYSDSYLGVDNRSANRGAIFSLRGESVLTMSLDSSHGGFSGLQARDGVFHRRPGGRMVPGRWQHVCVVSAPDSPRLYVNGKLANFFDHDAVLTRTGYHGPAYLGARWATDRPYPHEGYIGRIDQIRVSRGARYVTDFVPPRRFDADNETVALFQMDSGWGNRVIDSSGNQLNGKLLAIDSQIPQVKWIRRDESDPLGSAIRVLLKLSGPSGSAIRFAEARETIRLQKLKGAFTGPITLEAWVHLDSVRGRPKILCWGGEAGLGVSKRKVEPPEFSFYNQVKSEAGRSSSAFSPAISIENDWTHIAGTWDSGIVSLYQNGVLVSRTASQFQTGDPDGGEVYVGGPTNRFSGLIDEIRASSCIRYREDFVPERRFETDANTILLLHCDDVNESLIEDVSGNGHHGVVDGATLAKRSQLDNIYYPAGVSHDNFALQLGQNSSQIDLPVTVDGSGPFTIEFLVKLDRCDGVTSLLSSPNAFLSLTKTTAGDFQPLDEVDFRVFDGQRMHRSAVSIDLLEGQGWAHVAAAWDGHVPKLFINGDLVDQRAVGIRRNKPLDDSKSTVIGHLTEDSQSFIAMIDEVRISNTVPYTEDFEVVPRLTTDYNTLGLYHFAEGAGKIATDSSGHGRHGEIGSATWIDVDSASEPARRNAAH